MANRRKVVVLGLGRFGSAVARELMRLGHDVLALDAADKEVQELADEVSHAVRVDVTDMDALRELGVEGFDAAIVAISSSMEVSILTTVLLKQLGVKRIVAKAANNLHGSILQQVGASRVVYPERDTGVRVAHSFAAPGVLDYLDVAPGYGFARVPVAEAMMGKSLAELDLRTSCGVTIMALYRSDSVTLNPHSAEILRPGDALIVAGSDEDLERLPGTATEDGR